MFLMHLTYSLVHIYLYLFVYKCADIMKRTVEEYDENEVASDLLLDINAKQSPHNIGLK